MRNKKKKKLDLKRTSLMNTGGREERGLRWAVPCRFTGSGADGWTGSSSTLSLQELGPCFPHLLHCRQHYSEFDSRVQATRY